MTGVREWKKSSGRKKRDVLEENRELVSLRRRESRDAIIVKKRPNELDMFSNDNTVVQTPVMVWIPPGTPENVSMIGNPVMVWTPPATPEGVSTIDEDEWNQEYPVIFSPTQSIDSDYFSDNEDIQYRVTMIHKLLLNDQVVSGLKDFIKLLNEFTPDENESTRSLLKDQSFINYLLSMIGCQVPDGTNNEKSSGDNEMDTDVKSINNGSNRKANVPDSPFKSGFSFDPSPNTRGFIFPNDADIDLEFVFKNDLRIESGLNGKFGSGLNGKPPRQDIKIVVLALEAIHAIIDEGFGHVFGDVSNLIPALINHILSIEEKINRKVVQRSLEVILVLIKNCETLSFPSTETPIDVNLPFPSTETPIDVNLSFPSAETPIDMNDWSENPVPVMDKRKTLLSRLVSSNMFQSLDHVSKVVTEEILLYHSLKDDHSYMKGVERKDQYFILAGIEGILRDLIDDMETEREVISSYQQVIFNRESTLFILLRMICTEVQVLRKCPGPTVDLVIQFLKLFKKELEFGPPKHALKEESLVHGLRKEKTLLSESRCTPIVSYLSSLLPFIQVLCSPIRPTDAQLAGIRILECLPTHLIITQGLFYPLLDIVIKPPVKVQMEGLDLLIRLVQDGPNEILVLITRDFLKDLIPEMILTKELKVSQRSIRLIRKLFQRAKKFNKTIDWIVPMPGHTFRNVSNLKVDVLSFMKARLESFNLTQGIFYTW